MVITMKLIERKNYLNKLKNVVGTPDIKVITGVRRSGKSKLLESFIQYLQSNDPNANIIHINFNQSQYEDLTNYKELEKYIESKYLKNKNNYLFIDEIQMCTLFEKAINSLHASEKYDIYITGSNAFLLSSDLATLFTGRTFEIHIFPFSFSEFKEYYSIEDIDTAFDHYVYEGGMSGSYVYQTSEEKYLYISSIYKTLIVRDLIKKYRIRNKSLIEYLSNYLIDNIANITSIRNISNTLNKNHFETNNKTISSYVNYLCNAYAFYKVPRYDIKGKKYLSSLDKYYLSDHSFKYAILGAKNMDYGRVYENIVALELLRRGYEIYVGYLYKKEIDFVAIKRDEKIYIQVADDLSNEKTFKRETEPLLSIKDAYPKIIIARTKHPETIYEGIKIYDIARWLVISQF